MVVLVVNREMRGPFLALRLIMHRSWHIVRETRHLDVFVLGLLHDMSHRLAVAGRLPAVDKRLLLRVMVTNSPLIRVSRAVTVTLDLMVVPTAQGRDPDQGAVRGEIMSTMSVATPVLQRLSVVAGSGVFLVDQICEQTPCTLLVNL